MARYLDWSDRMNFRYAEKVSEKKRIQTLLQLYTSNLNDNVVK